MKAPREGEGQKGARNRDAEAAGVCAPRQLRHISAQKCCRLRRHQTLRCRICPRHCVMHRRAIQCQRNVAYFLQHGHHGAVSISFFSLGWVVERSQYHTHRALDGAHIRLQPAWRKLTGSCRFWRAQRSAQHQTQRDIACKVLLLRPKSEHASLQLPPATFC